MDLTPADLAPIKELYAAGRYLAAHAAENNRRWPRRSASRIIDA